jgi:Raf kinase inhibitor-like YbhB/YbcL family protein
MSEFLISSTNFKNGQEIPKKFGYNFENFKPEILINNIPKNTKALALVMDDPDAMEAVGKIWVHWIAFTNELIQSFSSSKIIEGINDFNEIGYGGPAPPDKRHTYIFKIYAIDSNLNLKTGFTKLELIDSIRGHIIGESQLTGNFSPQ